MEPVQLPEQSRQVQRRRGKARVQPARVPVVLHDVPDAAGRRRGAEKSVRPPGRRHLVALRVHHHRLVHGQPGGVSHRLSAGHSGRVPWRPCAAVQNSVRAPQWLRHHGLLSANGRHRAPLLRVRGNCIGVKLQFKFNLLGFGRI
jgi:hypothetical protein